MKRFSLYGYINFLEVTSGFVTPVFKDETYYYSQVERNNKVSSFVRLSKDYVSNIKKIAAKSVTLSRGEACIFAYYHRKKLYYGIPSKLASSFEDIDVDKELITSFLNRNNIVLPEEKINSIHEFPYPKVLDFKRPLEPSDKLLALKSLLRLKSLNAHRARFYFILNKASLFNTLIIFRFIKSGHAASIVFIREIDDLIVNIGGEKKHRGLNLGPRVKLFSAFDSFTIAKADRIEVINYWLKQENEAHKIYENILQSNSGVPTEIRQALKIQLDFLYRTYAILKNLIYEYSDVDV